jgi:hypothetical protein
VTRNVHEVATTGDAGRALDRVAHGQAVGHAAAKERAAGERVARCWAAS